ncbi:MAG: M28 family peptidase [Bacteroides sp.]|jgi:Zn-dependent M28 family amino/carboxypeptidase|nr:M28 family peptidase [Bacteroides sp.]
MTSIHKYLPFIFLPIMLFAIACSNSGNRQAGNNPAAKNNTPSVQVPVFNQDSAYAYVASQVAFGPRVPNSEAHQQTAHWLATTLGRFADTVQVQQAKVRAYDGTVLNISNIVASFKPGASSRILLCAHWDSRPYADFDPDPANHYTPIPGANDGASGVGVLIEIARVLSQNEPGIGIDIVLFDAEDYGEHEQSNQNAEDSWGLGSQYWSNTPHRHDYNARFGILLDMVGAGGAQFRQEGFSMFYAPNIVRKVWATARRIGYGAYFVEQQGGYVTDDHYYVNKIRNIPTINIIHQEDNNLHGFFPQWHTLEDDMDIIDPNTLKAVGQTVLAVIFEEK